MQNNKKILYIVTIPDWGGAQKYVYDAALIDVDLKDDVIVCSGKPSGFSNISLFEKCKKNNIKTHIFNNLVRQINPIKDWFAIKEIKRFIDEERPDAIYSNSSKAGFLTAEAVRISNCKPKLIYTVHGWVFLEPMSKWKKLLYRLLEKRASKFRKNLIVLGENEKSVALTYKICSEEKIVIIPHSNQKIEFDSDARTVLGLPDYKKIVGTIANFYPAKGLNYLIEAAAKINDPEAIFAIIGDGPLRTALESQIDNYKLRDKFFLLGEIDDAARFLPAFDIFVLPSIKEGLPYALLEAMQAGRKIVATDVGNVAEALKNYQFINSGEGTLEDHQIYQIVPPADATKLAGAIETMLSKKSSVQAVYGTTSWSVDARRKLLE